MLKTKKLFLVAACCIAMAVPGTAFAAEESDSADVQVITEENALTDEQASEEVTNAEQVENDSSEEAVTADSSDTITEESEEVSDSTDNDEDLNEETVSDTKVEDDGTEDGLVIKKDDAGTITAIYYYRDGEMVKSELVEVDGNLYYFTEDGSAALKKRVVLDGASYYFLKDGTGIRGEVHYFPGIDEYAYFQDNGQLYQKTGTLVTIDGKTYTFTSDGYAIRSKLKKISGSYYYFGTKGAMYKTTGVVKKINGKYYSFQSNGKAYTNTLKKVNGAYYYFSSKGYAITDKLKTINGNKYYFKANGKAQTGWKHVGKNLYYFQKNGKAASGWMKCGSSWVYLNQNTKAKEFLSNVLHDAWLKIQNSSSNTSYYICVDTTNTKISIFQGSAGNWVPIKYFVCAVGKNATPTITGHYTVGSKGYSFSGNKYTCYYYTQIHGDYLFHSVLYNRGTFTIRSGALNAHVSHGCVRLAIENAKWIHDNMPSGTAIYLYR